MRNENNRSNLLIRLVILILLTFSIFGVFLERYIKIPFAGLFDDVAAVFCILVMPLVILLGQIRSVTKIDVFFLVFFLFISLSALLNNVPVDVFLMQIRSYFFPLVIILFISKMHLKLNTLKWLVLILASMIVILFSSALMELIIGRPLLYAENRFGDEITFNNGFRAFSLIGNPIDFSNFVALSLCVFYSALVSKLIEKKIGIILLIVCFLCLLLSASRGPIIAVIFSFSLFFIKKGVSLKQLILLPFIITPLTFLVGEKLFSRFADMNVSYFAEDQYRGLFLLKAIEVFWDNVWFGVGPGRFGGWVSINYKESPIYEQYSFDTKGISSIDMFWPHILPEVGVIGLAPLIIGFWFIYKKSIKKQGYKSNYERFISHTVQLMLPVCLAIGFFSISLETQIVSSMVAIFCGIFIRLNYEKSSVHTITKR